MREYLRNLRAEKNLTQAQVAKGMGVSTNAYGMIESGKRQTDMNFSTAIKLAKVFRVSVNKILEEEKKLSQESA